MHPSLWKHLFKLVGLGSASVVFDLFAGTGSSGLAGMELGLTMYLVDHDPKIREMAMKRLYYYWCVNPESNLPNMTASRSSAKEDWQAKTDPNPNLKKLNKGAFWMGKKNVNCCIKISDKFKANTEKGVFATMNLPKGEKVGEYRGYVYKPEANAGNSSNKVIRVGEWNILAHMYCGVSYVNDPKDLDGCDVNCIFIASDEVATLTTSKAVGKGEELFAAYGPEYWENQEKTVR
jgi:hypothetical protein